MAMLRRFLSLLSIGLMVGCGTTKEPDTLNIGAVLALSGESAYWGKNLKLGMELAKGEINSTGGLLGKQLTISYEDSKSNPTDAVDAINKLISAGTIECILGDALSSNTLAMAPICQARKKVLLNFCVAAELSHVGDFIFRNWNSALLEADFIGAFSVRHSKRIALLYQNDSYGTSLKNAFVDKVSTAITIVYTDAFNRGTTDFRSTISKFVKLDYDAIYVPTYYEEALRFLRQYKELGGKPVAIYGVSEWDQTTLKDFIRENYPDLVYYPYPLPPPADSPARRRFLTAYQQKYGGQPEYLADNGYDAVNQLKYGIDKAGVYDATKVKDALHTMRDFPGATGVMSFDANGDVNKPYGVRTFSRAGAKWYELN